MSNLFLLVVYFWCMSAVFLMAFFIIQLYLGLTYPVKGNLWKEIWNILKED
jgi:hypothetical protein